MDFHPPLIEARLERRYKRFLADVRFGDGTRATAHCPNPGSMLGLARPGCRIWLSRNASPRRKLSWTWELVETETGVLVGIHTGRANDLVHEALQQGRIAELTTAADGGVSREVRISAHSRIDFLLSPAQSAEAHVEVKSVTLSRVAGLAEFPDSRTARGARHMRELASLAADGRRAVLLYVTQRGDCRRFAPARDIDAEYCRAMQDGIHAGVEILCYDCVVGAAAIRIGKSLPVAVF